MLLLRTNGRERKILFNFFSNLIEFECTILNLILKLSDYRQIELLHHPVNEWMYIETDVCKIPQR